MDISKNTYSNSYPIIKDHYGIKVVRDDLLPGGTKSILMPLLDDPTITEFVYASPVYGGFQIALAMYCKSVGKRATIFCAQRNVKHANTLKCIANGAQIIDVSYGYLSVIEKKAREYCQGKPHIKKIIFGASTHENKLIIACRVKKVIEILGQEPDEIWCAVGSGTLISGILMAVSPNVKVVGVQVGADFKDTAPNLTIIKYPKPFDKESKLSVEFPSTPNYDLKAFEICLKQKGSGTILFWNVY
jgi:1-aminocyclopropane-1-carboxylate deaminase/D-cysteine desulfhydrase-like pyridoxal-dependent ACC family enzyme